MLAVGSGVDVISVVERQPSLLLSDGWSLNEVLMQRQQQEQERVGRGSEEAGGPRQHDSEENVCESDAGQSPDPLNDGLVAPVGSSSSSSSGGDHPSGSSGGGGGDSSSSSSGNGSVQQRVVEAWEFGLSADGDAEWEQRYGQLLRYKSVHGDAHCGFREGDDAALTRWAGSRGRGGRREMARVKLEWEASGQCGVQAVCVCVER